MSLGSQPPTTSFWTACTTKLLDSLMRMKNTDQQFSYLSGYYCTYRIEEREDHSTHKAGCTFLGPLPQMAAETPRLKFNIKY